MNISLPSFTWLPGYDRSWLRGDLVAAITLAAYHLPAALMAADDAKMNFV